MNRKEEKQTYYKSTTISPERSKADIEKLLKDFKIEGVPLVSHIGINITQANNVIIDHISIDDCYYAGIILHDVIKTNVSNSFFRRCNKDGLGYGICIENACRGITVNANHFTNCRHAVCAGGDHGYGVQYAMIWSNNEGSHDETDTGMFGPHPTTDGLIIEGNTANGCSLGFANGKNTKIIGNHIRSNAASGIYLPSTSEGTVVIGNDIEVTNNHGISVRTEKSGIYIYNNIIKCLTASYDGISVAGNITDIKIDNNKINVSGYGVNVTSYGGTTPSSNVTISNNIITSSAEVGIHVESAVQEIQQPISHVRILNNDINAYIHGINIEQANAVITELSINDNIIKATSTGHGVYITSSGSAIYTKVDISRNIIYSSVNGIDLDKCTIINVCNNHVYNASGYGLLLRTLTYYIVKNNEFTNCATALQNNSGITGRIIRDNIGYNPTGIFGTAPTIPASGSTNKLPNNYGYPCNVMIAGGTVTAIYINDTVTGLTTGSFYLSPGATIALVYSVAPTWIWNGL